MPNKVWLRRRPSAGTADPDPTLTTELKRAVTAKFIIISQAGSRLADLGLYDRITVVEFRINPGRVHRNLPDQVAGNE